MSDVQADLKQPGQHDKFLERLANSSGAVFAVALNQHKKGRTVEIPPVRYAPTAGDAEGFVDEGDLVIVTRSIIEVKQIRHSFTGRADWPFKEALVSNKAAVDRRINSVAAYVTVGGNLSHACVIPRSTRPHWHVVEKLASNTGNVEKFYACPLDKVRFETL